MSPKNSIHFLELGAPLPVQQIQTVLNNTNQTLLVTWIDKFDMLYNRLYCVKVSKNNQDWVTMYTGGEVKAEISGLDNGVEYTVCVVALKSNGEEAVNVLEEEEGLDDSTWWDGKQLPFLIPAVIPEQYTQKIFVKFEGLFVFICLFF